MTGHVTGGQHRVDDETFDLGPVPTRVAVPTAVVRRLVADQLPQWAHLPVEPVADGGWDNWTFHLGDELVVRLPSAAEYALAVEKEHRWLPMLAPRLPLPVPNLLARGAPGTGYPYPWSVYGWIAGRPAAADRVADPVTFAGDLAAFLAALQAVDPADGPRPGVHNWFRGGPLRTYDRIPRDALAELDGHDLEFDVGAARDLWLDAVSVRWDGVDRWFHGDIAAGNLLLDDAGQVAAVIDFGTCGVGDAACDLAVAWTLLSADGRHAFRNRLGIDDPTWTRGRGWALWKAVATCSAASDSPEDRDELVRAVQVLEAVVQDE